MLEMRAINPRAPPEMEGTTNAQRGTGPPDVALTICPSCGEDTGIQRELDQQLGPVSVDELETLVRNEWRRRLGSSSYRRDHSRAIIRALIIYALAPESPVRSAVTQQLIWWELTTLGAWGLNRAAIKHEFREFSRAVLDVLTDAGLDADRSRDLKHRMEQKLDETLDWAEPARLELDEP